MAAFWELYMFHYILINSSWLRKRDAKRRSQLARAASLLIRRRRILRPISSHRSLSKR